MRVDERYIAAAKNYDCRLSCFAAGLLRLLLLATSCWLLAVGYLLATSDFIRLPQFYRHWHVLSALYSFAAQLRELQVLQRENSRLRCCTAAALCCSALLPLCAATNNR